MSDRQFDIKPEAPARARAIGIEWRTRCGGSLSSSMARFVVATHSLA